MLPVNFRTLFIRPIRYVIGAIRRVFVQELEKLAPRRDSGGITLLYLGSTDDAADRLLDKLERAIDLVRREGQIRAQRHLRRVIVVRSRTVYSPSVDACAINEVTLRGQTLEWVASLIVHEAAHGRLWRSGFRYDDARTKRRVEEACTAAQIRFLRRLPGTQPLIDHAARQLSIGWF